VLLLTRFTATNVPAPLLPSIAARAVDLPKPRDLDTELPKEKSGTPPTTLSSASTEKKIPKWLKAGLSMSIDSRWFILSYTDFQESDHTWNRHEMYYFGSQFEFLLYSCKLLLS
jgi:hypothetical protein